MFVDFLREFSRANPLALIPGGLWLAAEARRAMAPGRMEEVKVAQAARLVSRSEKAIREACPEIRGAYRDSEKGHWRIPVPALLAYFRAAAAEQPPSDRRKHGPRQKVSA